MGAFPGQPLNIRAADWNRVLAFVDSQRTGQSNVGSSPAGTVVAKNTTGGALKWGSVARLSLASAKSIAPGKALSEQFFELSSPDNTLASWDDLCVLLEPIADGKRGRVCVSGVCWALVQASSEPTTNTDKMWLVPASVSSVWMFRRMWSGCAKLVSPLASGQTTGSTSSLCPVILGDRQPWVRCTLTSGWTAGVATATVEDIREGAFAASTTTNVYDPDGLFSDLVSTDTLTGVWIGGNRVLAGNAACAGAS